MKWVLTLLATVLFLFNTAIADEKTLVLDIFPLSENIDPRFIKSASEYIVIQHLTRGLVTLNKEGFIQGDLAKTWRISKDKLGIEFELRQDQFFSNGEKIDSASIVESINWLLKHNSTTHVDLKVIETVIAVGKTKVKFTLKKPLPNFLRKFCHAEFGIMHKSDFISKTPTFNISSGYYFFKSKEQKIITLQKNPFNKPNLNPFKFLSFRSTNAETQHSDLINGKIDFAVPYSGNMSNFAENTSQKQYKKLEPHIGFTYWLAFNLKSKIFQKLECRSKIFKAIKGSEIGSSEVNMAFWQVANQLYLPLGPGRLTKSEESHAEKIILGVEQRCEIDSIINLLLPAKWEWNSFVISALEKNKIKLNLSYYSNQDEFVKKYNDQVDLFVNNNDFSSLDLSENIFVTFNETRPLIHRTPRISELLAQISAEEIDENLYEFYHKVGKEVLKNVLIVPLFYKRVNFYHSSKLDLSEWSTLSPEISAWKIKLASSKNR